MSAPSPSAATASLHPPAGSECTLYPNVSVPRTFLGHLTFRLVIVLAPATAAAVSPHASLNIIFFIAEIPVF